VLATRLPVLTQFFSFLVVRIADEHLRQNGVSTVFFQGRRHSAEGTPNSFDALPRQLNL
jgi:hypothetical protein